MAPSPTLSEAKALLQSGNATAAIEMAESLGARHAGNLNLQMETGFFAREAGGFEVALACFGRALRLAPDNLQIGNIIANTLSAAGRAEEALEFFNRLLARNPRYLEGQLNRGITAHEARHPKALEWLNEALGFFPENARLWSLKADILRTLDQTGEGLEAVRKAIELEPGNPLHHMRMGIILRRAEQMDEALAAYNSAERLGAAGTILATAKAAVLLELDRVDEAEALYELAHRAGDQEAGLALMRLRREYRSDPDAASHLARAAREGRTRADWLQWLGALASFGDFERLLGSATEALAVFPGDPEVLRLSAMATARNGDPSSAYEQLEMLERDGQSASLQCDLAETALMAGNPISAAEHAERALTRYPHHEAALAFLTLAWRELGDRREHWLCDYERMVVSIDVAGPDGEDPQAFAGKVAEALDDLHRTRVAPGDQSLRDGTQTSGRLFARKEVRIVALQKALQEAIRRVLASMPMDTDHPFYSRNTNAFDWVGSWSVKLAGGTGVHVPHYHAEGWMSSAYYARLPPVMKGRADHQGWIAFGEPPAYLGLNQSPRRLVQPREGRLVLFPSYFWHHTLQFGGTKPRLTAAFDILPA